MGRIYNLQIKNHVSLTTKFFIDDGENDVSMILCALQHTTIVNLLILHRFIGHLLYA